MQALSTAPRHPLPELARLLRAEAELIADLEVEDQVISGALGQQHPMAWRHLADLDAVEALTLVAASPAELDTMPDWRDPGWSIEALDLPRGQALTLWWHAATQQAMLASQIPLMELRPDAVAHTLQLHREGVGACRERRVQPWPDAHPGTALGLCFG